MKAGLIQMRITDSGEDNLRRAAGMVAAMGRCGVEITILPEMFLCQYEQEAFRRFAKPAGGEVWHVLGAAAKGRDSILWRALCPNGEREVVCTMRPMFLIRGGGADPAP